MRIATLFLAAVLAAAAPAKRAAAPSGWTVQIASTSSREEADRLVSVLVGRDAPAWFSQTDLGGRTMYRIRVGHFASKAAAKAFADGLPGELKNDYWIAPDDSAVVPTPLPPAATPMPSPSATTPVIATRPSAAPSATASTATTPSPAPSASPLVEESATRILADAMAAHGGAKGGFAVLDRAGSVALRYRLKSLDAKTGEPVFTHHVYLRKGKDRLRLEIEPLEGTGPSSTTLFTPKGAWVDAAGVRTGLTPPTARARIESLGPAGMLRLPLEFPQKGAAAAGFVTAAVAGPRTLNGDAVIRLDAAPPPSNYREASLYLDPSTHRLAAARFLTDAGELLLTFGDYRVLAPGLVVPFRRMVYRDGTVVSSVELDEFVLDGPIDDALFAK